MLHKFGWLIAFIIGGWMWFTHAYDPPVIWYNRAGRISNKQIKIWNDTISVSSANPTVSIAAAGFTSVINVQAQIIQSTPTVSNFTWCNVTSYSTSSVALFLTQENSSTVNILGNIVLLGTPLQQPSSPSNTFVALTVVGF